ncbi:hypothetical protein BCM02_114125 [Paenibacillus methanolicus]|uniref:Uncharacterized protein n=1 Tax=Paenibacillus methanolicus TaxID=582686 RepID=A0A5S5BTE1_9BACL|nr:hypothetical protein BCM02_114125 [Paenibacillus methanolicus]
MAALVDFVVDHWLPVSLVVLTALAIAYITAKHKALFYKE